MTIVIRRANLEDVSAIYNMVRELAEYEKAPHEVTATEEIYEQCMSDGTFECMVAETDGQIIGICLYYMS